ncbi:MAG: phage tail protein [Achromobacter mucicolens]
MDVLSYATGYMPMLLFGDFMFSLNSAAPQEINRSTSYNWPAQERVGQLAALQFTGPGEDTFELPGVIYPSYRGGLAQMDMLRIQAAKGLPQYLVDGQGNVYGRYVLERVEERRSTFSPLGIPLKIEFALYLKKFDCSQSNLLVSAAKQLINQVF